MVHRFRIACSVRSNVLTKKMTIIRQWQDGGIQPWSLPHQRGEARPSWKIWTTRLAYLILLLMCQTRRYSALAGYYVRSCFSFDVQFLPLKKKGTLIGKAPAITFACGKIHLNPGWLLGTWVSSMHLQSCFQETHPIVLAVSLRRRNPCMRNTSISEANTKETASMIDNLVEGSPVSCFTDDMRTRRNDPRSFTIELVWPR